MAKVVGSEAVRKAIERRAARRAAQDAKVEMYINETLAKINVPLKTRVQVAVRYLRSRTVDNISVPVMKEKSKKTGRIVVTERSKPGEFPRADTGTLRRTLFTSVEEKGGGIEGYVGTPLDYGVVLELRRERQFLTRTLNEELGRIRTILTKRITA